MAFDFKKAGLNIAENTAKDVVKNLVRPFAQDYIANSANKIDDILLPFLDQLEAAILTGLDKIDGEEG